jgi:uncharacterized membrane protein YsdA (DUF1294 family)
VAWWPLGFLAVLTAAVGLGQLPPWLALIYGSLSLITFIIYGWDKRSARYAARRIPEVLLHLLALLGGWPGAWLGQVWWRHKSRKPAFRWRFWLTVLLNLGLLGLGLFRF